VGSCTSASGLVRVRAVRIVTSRSEQRLPISAVRVLLILAVMALGVAGCAGQTTSLTEDTTGRAVAGISYANGTTLAIDLYVNGHSLLTMSAGTNGRIPASQLPALPWLVESRTASSRVLSTLTVRLGDVVAGPSGSHGDAVRVTLSCGALDIWSGPPLGGPVATPGSSDDCSP
jgi:hypothetical protein